MALEGKFTEDDVIVVECKETGRLHEYEFHKSNSAHKSNYDTFYRCRETGELTTVFKLFFTDKYRLHSIR